MDALSIHIIVSLADRYNHPTINQGMKKLYTVTVFLFVDWKNLLFL